MRRRHAFPVFFCALLAAALLSGQPAAASDGIAAKLSLSPAEASFVARINRRPALRAIVSPESGPYAAFAEGRLVGIIPDIAAIIRQRTGLKIELVPLPSFREYADAIEKGNYDLILDAVDDSAFGLAPGTPYTKSYLSISFTNICLKDSTVETTRIASPGRYSSATVYISSHYHSEQTVIYNGRDECLAALQSGRCSVAVLNDFAADRFIDGEIRSPYKKAFSAIQNEPVPLCIALRAPSAAPSPEATGLSPSDTALLLELLDRAIGSISTATRSLIILRHSRFLVPDPTFIDFIYLHPFGAVAAALGLALFIILILIILYQRRRQNTQESYRRNLELAVERAEAANQAKAEFLSRVSHDIRTPINIIGGMTDFALEDIHNTDKLSGDLAKIKSANTFLLSLINDVLDISKIDSGKIELNPEPYPYDEYMANIRNMFEPLCAQKGIKFTIIHKGNCRTAIVDRVRFNQIALNLLSNAVKYTPPGGSVSYTNENRDLPDGRVSLSIEVKDSGIGMSPEFQERMFEPFSQEYDNPKRPKTASGTGLGLSIVKRIIELMNGSIEVQSAIGQGTAMRCHFVFPALPEGAECAPAAVTASVSGPDSVPVPETVSAAASPGVPRPANPAVLSQTAQTGATPPPLSSFPPLKGHILLAEDNALNAEIARRLLEGFGLSVDLAENGATAVKRFTTSDIGAYSLILMDIQMPVLNGYEATDAIRALVRPDASGIPIVALTADAFDADVEKSQHAGMDAHLAKPIDRLALYNILATFLPAASASS